MSAIWNYKCPRCREAKIFKEPFELSKPLEMPHHCSVCGQRFEPEPGFYYGAMFISYIFSGWILLVPTLILVFYFKWSAVGAISFTIFLAALMYIRLVRGSRSIWLHLNVKYDKEWKAKLKS